MAQMCQERSFASFRPNQTPDHIPADLDWYFE
jgi:hypothetical protein